MTIPQNLGNPLVEIRKAALARFIGGEISREELMVLLKEPDPVLVLFNQEDDGTYTVKHVSNYATYPSKSRPFALMDLFTCPDVKGLSEEEFKAQYDDNPNMAVWGFKNV